MSGFLWTVEMFYRKHVLGQKFRRFEVNPELFAKFEWHVCLNAHKT